jgi:hypothetical protein
MAGSSDPLAAIAERYRRFAVQEARGRSPLYEELALGVAGDHDLLRFLAGLPKAKQQPNMLLAAARLVCGTASGWSAFRAAVGDRLEETRAVMLERRTQTNEPARCATLLPLLAQLPGPLALIEVGAAGGLCLLPDHYAFDFGLGIIPSASGTPAPVFRCRVFGDVPVPSANVRVVWRRGLDIDPVDVRDPQQVAWLRALVWPGEGERLALLDQAIQVAARLPPAVLRGDLVDDLPALVSAAPPGATTVVFHTAVLPYVPPDRREVFCALVSEMPVTWIANEGPGLVPDARDAAGEPPQPGSFLLSLNGDPVAWTDPHGAWIEWIGTGAGDVGLTRPKV